MKLNKLSLNIVFSIVILVASSSAFANQARCEFSDTFNGNTVKNTATFTPNPEYPVIYRPASGVKAAITLCKDCIVNRETGMPEPYVQIMFTYQDIQTYTSSNGTISSGYFNTKNSRTGVDCILIP
jgi:hypothetical protein